MRPILPLQRTILGFGFAAVITPLAVGATFLLPVFRSIPWTLSYLVLALVSEVGGVLPALVSGAISSCGIYLLVLAPRDIRFHTHDAWLQVGAFLVTSGFIIYLVRQRSLAMSSLQASEAHYRRMTESASDVVITIDEGSRILAINPSVKSVFGYDPGELIGKQMVVLMPERMRARHLAGIAQHVATGERHIPWTGVQLPGLRKDGQEIPLEISFASYVYNGHQRFTGFIRDISERERTQAALIQSEKLAAVGRLASSIAHEINNPLEAVTNLLFLARECTDAAQIQDYLELADQELRRVSVIASQTLQFHRQSTSPIQVNCDELMDGSLALFQGKLVNAHISLERRRRAQRVARCVGGEIRQVLNNLIGNAIDATRRGGRILVRSRDATDWKSGRSGVVLTIADTGTGISPEVRSRMFEPFFSTKGEAGSGLGLWICSHLIAKNSGVLRVRSSQRPQGSGTVFTLFLPDTAMGAETNILEAAQRG